MFAEKVCYNLYRKEVGSTGFAAGSAGRGKEQAMLQQIISAAFMEGSFLCFCILAPSTAAMIIIAISLLLFAAFTTYTTEAQNIDVYSWDYESGANSHEYLDDYGWYGLSADSHVL